MDIIKLLENYATDVLVLALPVYFCSAKVDKKLQGRLSETVILINLFISILIASIYCLCVCKINQEIINTVLSKGFSIWLVSLMYKMLISYINEKKSEKCIKKDKKEDKTDIYYKKIKSILKTKHCDKDKLKNIMEIINKIDDNDKNDIGICIVIHIFLQRIRQNKKGF